VGDRPGEAAGHSRGGQPRQPPSDARQGARDHEERGRGICDEMQSSGGAAQPSKIYFPRTPISIMSNECYIGRFLMYAD
jgi:hypothetical protein